jgi:hypothetical protein
MQAPAGRSSRRSAVPSRRRSPLDTGHGVWHIGRLQLLDLFAGQPDLQSRHGVGEMLESGR